MLVACQAAFSCSKLIIETLEQGVKYVQIYFKLCSSVSIVNFEHEIASWVVTFIFLPVIFALFSLHSTYYLLVLLTAT